MASSIGKAAPNSEAELFTSHYPNLSKAQFVDPPMEWATIGFTKHYAEQVTRQAGHRASREKISRPLIAEFRQRATWADWPIYDINCEDPPEVE